MSAACAIWPDSSRIELWAISTGECDNLTEADGFFAGPAAVPPIDAVLSRVDEFDEPPSMVCGDPHRHGELQSWARSRGVRCVQRGGRSASLVSDIQAARRMLLDDGGSIALGSKLLQMAAGETSLTGDGRALRKTGEGRDDPLRAFILCAGAAAPRAAPPAASIYVQGPAW